MKIAFILKLFPETSETFILNQIIYLVKEGHEVDIFANPSDSAKKIHPAVNEHKLLNRTYYWNPPKNRVLRVIQSAYYLATRYPQHGKLLRQTLNRKKYGKEAWSFRLFFKVITLLNHSKDYDIIQCHFGYNGNLALLLRELGAIQGSIVTTFHGIDITREVQIQGNHIYDGLFTDSELCLAISNRWREKLIDLGCSPKKAILHRLGIDTQELRYQPSQVNPQGSLVVLTVARLIDKKGVEFGIRAVAQALQQGSKIQYYIVGDGYLRPELESLIQVLQVEKQVHLLGWHTHDEVLALMGKASLVMAPSITSPEGDQEGIPVTLMEAMAVGRPVLSTLHSGIPELVQDGVSGYLVAERDVDGLANRLVEFAMNPKLCETMGGQGRRFVEQNYDLLKSNQKLFEIYQCLIEAT